MKPGKVRYIMDNKVTSNYSDLESCKLKSGKSGHFLEQNDVWCLLPPGRLKKNAVTSYVSFSVIWHSYTTLITAGPSNSPDVP